tara:strand:+ start:562 stop:2292 length:1731 start_codon:yes stop_codon:yes gene_type:complete
MATETIVSPGVLLQEVDRSFITPGVDPSGLAIIGPTVKGPVEIPTIVENYNDFKNIFGTTIESASNAFEYFTNLTVKNYFQNGGSSTIVTRVVTDRDNWSPATSSLITAVSSSNDINNPFIIETLSKGTINNSTSTHLSNGALDSGSKNNLRWEISNLNKNAGTFTLVIRRGDDTTAKPIVLEQFTNCSLDPLSANYIAKKVGDQVFEYETDKVVARGEFPNRSNFVRIKTINNNLYEYQLADGSVNVDSGGFPFSNRLPNSGSGSFGNAGGGNLDGNPLFGKNITSTNIQGLDTTDYTNAITLMKNKEEYKFKTLVVPGLNQQNHSSTINTIIENTTGRGDSFFIVDLVPYGSNTSTVASEAGELDTSFAAAYWPWAQVRSAELGRNVECPASVVIPGVYAKNDSIAAPWFAPAGLTRGGITNVTKVEKKLSKAVRDTLYSSKVNPLATFPSQGIVVFGQKTLQTAASALDRVNVRRLLLDVKDTINGFSKSIVFEQNTQQTRDRFVRQATPYLESLVQRQGLFAFQIKMDGQLNTPDIIDENKLVGQVFLQPTRTAEFIVLDFILTPTGASFTD